MLEVRNIRIPLASYPSLDAKQQQALLRYTANYLGLSTSDIVSCKLRKRSFDARKRGSIKIVCTARIELASPELETRLAAQNTDCIQLENTRGTSQEPGSLTALLHESKSATKSRVHSPLEERIVVVGAGSAGLFCALTLAQAGLEPVLVERGDDATRRNIAIQEFNAHGTLDTESNIQFGLGGAGTFSDGKLYTGTRSAAHRAILETFVVAGASPNILVDAHPHIGSDLLPQVVEHIRDRIKELGGEIRLRTRLDEIVLSGTSVGVAKVAAVRLHTRHENSTVTEEELPCSHLVLACGHSARDVYEHLNQLGVTLERKSFAMGVRIEHLQANIDKALWGKDAGNPVLGAAPYKLVFHPHSRASNQNSQPSNGGGETSSPRNVFSFCMCPGGYVVAASSEQEAVVTNGMSLSARDGINANAGLLANVEPHDLPGDNPLAGLELQRRCEQAAYRAGGGAYVAPAQLLGDFLAKQPSSEAARVQPTYPRGVRFTTLEDCLPNYILESLRAAIPALGRKLKGFDTPDAVLTGVETRSSSPVRIPRNENLQAINTQGLFPAGEGAGYAGGIMSAATDGIRVAEAIIQDLAR